MWHAVEMGSGGMEDNAANRRYNGVCTAGGRAAVIADVQHNRPSGY
jgi:hypothetical protein